MDIISLLSTGIAEDSGCRAKRVVFDLWSDASQTHAAIKDLPMNSNTVKCSE
ncbi:hypothetical protein [Caballeronia sp. LZ043]|uniref:hypothetical protein n=1 Tax=Caballeronia sp. LZ043 TaxID=3038569 RepID=UPI0028565DA1|nr:hypothetical protein [Caballeronia sp. LZ043]MDR5823106.1 hypothetical protein [Caballeronia sp. LZ043]